MRGLPDGGAKPPFRLQSFQPGEYMKTPILIGLLAGALASHSASAAIRTFEYTATISSIIYDNTPAQSAPGINDGSIVAEGDTLKGRFSFDDAGNDWSNPHWDMAPAISVSYTFERDGASFSTADPGWALSRGRGYTFSIGSHGSPQENPFFRIGLVSPDPFSWDLNESLASITMAWSDPGIYVIARANLTGLSEVSVSPVPEPATYAMLLVGAAAAAGAARRRAAGQAG